jgi:hypothetical protein
MALVGTGGVEDQPVEAEVEVLLRKADVLLRIGGDAHRLLQRVHTDYLAVLGRERRRIDPLGVQLRLARLLAGLLRR